MASKIGKPVYVIQLDSAIISVKSNLLKAHTLVLSLLPPKSVQRGQGYHQVRRNIELHGSFDFRFTGQPPYVIKKQTIT